MRGIRRGRPDALCINASPAQIRPGRRLKRVLYPVCLVLKQGSCKIIDQTDHQSILTIHPSGASILPIWIPVSVSYSFCITGPIFSIPLENSISLP